MDLSRHTSLAGLAEAITSIQAAAARLRLEVFVVGAQARDLWLAFGAGVETGRKTNDVDFAVRLRRLGRFRDGGGRTGCGRY